MSIDSLSFLFGFLPALVVLTALIRKFAPALIVPTLLAISAGYYVYTAPEMAGVMALLVAMNVGFATAIAAWPRWSKALVALGVVAHLTPLVVWKLTGQGQIPLGLSFVTFLHLSALLDLRSGAPKLSVSGHALYSAFFASVTAGPITRYKDLAPQILTLKDARISLDDILAAMALFILGLAKVGLLGRPVQDAVTAIALAAGQGETLSLAEAWYALWGALIALYFLFSGYSDMAMALGLCVGLRLAQNFNSPLKARSAADFYNRWHMSLTGFIRAFIFSPVVKWVRKTKIGSIESRAIWGWASATVISLTVIGAWHGATMMFVLGGALGGILMVVVQLPVMLGYRQIGAHWLWGNVGRVVLLLLIAGFALLHQVQLADPFWAILSAVFDPAQLTVSPEMASRLPDWLAVQEHLGGLMPNTPGSARLLIAQLGLATLIVFATPNSMQIMGLMRGEGGRMRWKTTLGWGLWIGLLAGLCVASIVGQQASGFVYDAF